MFPFAPPYPYHAILGLGRLVHLGVHATQVGLPLGNLNRKKLVPSNRLCLYVSIELGSEASSLCRTSARCSAVIACCLASLTTRRSFPPAYQARVAMPRLAPSMKRRLRRARSALRNLMRRSSSLNRSIGSWTLSQCRTSSAVTYT